MWSFCSFIIVLCVRVSYGMTSSGCNTNWEYEDDCNLAFFKAAQDGDLAFINVELAKGSALRLNWRNRYYSGYTALHIAAKEGNAQVVQAFQNAGANQEMKEEVYGHTPIHLAAKYGHYEVILILLERYPRPDRDQVDNLGRSPLFLAAQTGNTNAAHSLRAYGAQGARDTDSDGNSALHWAAWSNYTDIAPILISAGALSPKRGTLHNQDSWTPSDWSRKYSDGSVAQIIDNLCDSPLCAAN